MKVEYKVYNPAGNITALVIGDKYNLEERKLINNAIMKKEPKVEQVGFLSKEKYKLTMAGGEFCGNATRCAVMYYMTQKKNISIEINNQKLKAGLDKSKNIWCEIPIEKCEINKINNEIYKVILKGITILVLKYNKDYKDLKKLSKDIIKLYNVDDEAVGVMFTEDIKRCISIYPVVWVKQIDTLFLENACGSGTIAVTMLKTFLTKKSSTYLVKQPSGDFLETDITIENNIIKGAILKGKIKTDNKTRKIIV